MTAPAEIEFTVPARPRVLGIDFSAATDAHRKIWVCEARRLGTGGAEVTSLRRIDSYFLRDAVKSRRVACRHVRGVIAAARDAVVGLDAPFSLPEDALAPGQSWADFADGFAGRFPTPESFRDAMRERFARREIRRACDVAAKTPWCAWNLRLYRQTWHAIVEVIAPLARAGEAWCPPMQEEIAGRPALVEACPAAALKARGAYLTGYKGAGTGTAGVRAEILSRLELGGLAIGVDDGRAAVLDSGGDALDAVAAALAVAQAAGKTYVAPEAARREAWVIA